MEPNPTTVGIRQLRSDVATFVRRAGSGEHLVISVGGRPTAQLGPVAAPEGFVRLSDLIARGAVIAPRRSGPWHLVAPIPVRAGQRLDRALRDIR